MSDIYIKLQNISQGKTIFVKFRKNLEETLFCSGGFPQQKSNCERLKLDENFRNT